MHLLREKLMRSGPWIVAGALVACISSGALVGGCLFHRAEDCALNPILDCFSSGTGSAVGGGGDGGTNPACVPSTNAAPVSDTCGVFVATSGNDANEGTKARPVATLAKAVEPHPGKRQPRSR